jgi:anaerobic dimethyl sulfoxide reductase subunit A
MNKINVSCNKDCGAGCPLTAHVENNKIIKITNNELAPKYFIGCPKGFLFQKVLYSKDRLLSPLLRTGKRGDGKFKPISWDKAYQIISDKIKDTIVNYGTDSILPFPASGSCRGTVHNTSLLSKRFFSQLGECTWPVGSYSSHAVSYAVPFVLGTMKCGVDPLTLLDSKMIVLWGANILDTRFGGRSEKILKEAKEKEIPIIVIDPRKTNTVQKLATEWIKINPATDTAFMSAVAYVLIKNNYIDQKYISKYTKGFEEYKQYILGNNDNTPKTPEWAAEVCGTTSVIIERFAKKYAETKPVALIPGLSIQRTIGGEEATRAAIILQTLTQNIGLRGGTSGGLGWCGLPQPNIPSIFKGNLRPRNTFPVYEWADTILSKELADIKLIYNTGSNLLNQGSDINKNIRAFNEVDFVVTHDSFLTPTALFSDIVLPVTMWPERNDIVNCSDNYLFYSNKAVEPPKSVKDDYSIFSELSERLDFQTEFTENRTSDNWLDYILKKSKIEDVEKFKETGIYDDGEHERVAFDTFIKNPDKYPLNTPSGLIEISSSKYAETGYPSIPICREITKKEKFPLTLITPHAKFRINSSNGNIDYFNKQEDDSLWINIEDAEERSIEDNSLVEVFNQRGRITVKAKVTDKIIKGTISLNQGIWVKITALDIDSAPNILTSTSPTLPSHGPRTHMTFVQVKALDYSM